jgi:hypothetical protein
MHLYDLACHGARAALSRSRAHAAAPGHVTLEER